MPYDLKPEIAALSRILAPSKKPADVGHFYVLTIGGRYVRFPESLIVGRNLVAARKFYTVDELLESYRKIKEHDLKKPVRALEVTIKEFDIRE